MVIATSYVLENDRQFAEALESAASKVSDLSFAMRRIKDDWFKSNKTIFNLKGSGLYPPLSPKYQEQKDQRFGRRLPIMVASGRLRDSVSGRPNSDSIVKVGKLTLIMGTKVPYGIYHQSDAPRFKIPLRKFLFIGPEAPRTAPSAVTGRLERFLNTIEAEVKRQLDGV